jgi:hypothetical protein
MATKSSIQKFFKSEFPFAIVFFILGVFFQIIVPDIFLNMTTCFILLTISYFLILGWIYFSPSVNSSEFAKCCLSIFIAFIYFCVVCQTRNAFDKRIEDDVQHHLSIRLIPPADNNLLRSLVEIRNDSNNPIGTHRIFYCFDESVSDKAGSGFTGVCKGLAESDDSLPPIGEGVTTDLQMTQFIKTPKDLDLTVIFLYEIPSIKGKFKKTIRVENRGGDVHKWDYQTADAVKVEKFISYFDRVSHGTKDFFGIVPDHKSLLNLNMHPEEP